MRVDRHRRHPERGASFIEYALLLGLFAVACTAATGMLDDRSGSKLADVQAVVSDLPKVSGSVTSTTLYGQRTTTTIAPTTSPPTTSTTTTAAPTTTTAAPTTTARPTTTTAAPTTTARPTTTTTTIPPTTTTAKATTSAVAASGAATLSQTSIFWSAGATFVVTDNYERPATNVTITVTMTVTRANGNVIARETLSATTDANGRVVFSDSGYTIYKVTDVSFTVTGASGGGLTWDGKPVTITN